MSTESDLSVASSARSMVAAVADGTISAAELMDLHLARIAERNPELNAVVSLDEERARAGAAAADRVPADLRGPLHGLPFAFKDTHDVAGWRTTYGSPLFADHVPEDDELIVERIRAAGAVPLGKTNVPEFAAGSHTFNTIFGTTLNPVDPTRSAGGSSGGAACALAADMVPLADGSDMGGSLRNPASFCGVVGLRPSLGRVPSWPTTNLWETTATSGPLARTVDDVALLLSVVAGPDPRVPTALGEPGHLFAGPVQGSMVGIKVALSVDLGGALEVDEQVASVVEASAAVLSQAGAQVASAWPDLSLGEDTFRTLRAWLFQDAFGELLAEHPDAFKSVAGGQHPGGGVADRCGRRPRLRPAHGAGGDDARLLHVVRRAGAAGLAGAAVPRRPGVPGGDQRPADGDLPGLDALGVPDHGHRLPGDLGAGRHHRGRPAGRPPAGRPARQRAPAARGGRGVRGRRRAARPTGGMNPQEYPPLPQNCG